MAKLSQQTNALVRKSIAYQRRNCCLNLFLISAPLIFCILLKLMQVAIDSALNSEDNRCGCKCISCAFAANGTFLPDGECPVSGLAYKKNLDTDPEPLYKCFKRDPSTCGFQYSTQPQIAWCPIEQPSLWPPPYALPDPVSRVDGPNTATALYTGQDRAVADTLAAGVVQQPNASVLTSPAVAQAAQVAVSGFETFSFDLSVYQLAGIDLGNNDTEIINLYVDSTLINGQAEVMAPDCAAVEALKLAETADAPSVEALLNYNCSTAYVGPSEFQPTRDEIEQKLYCGFRNARCQSAGSYFQAFDYQNSTQNTLNVVVYHNDSSKIGINGGGGQPTKTQRVNKAIDASISAFVRNWLGKDFRAQVAAQSDMPKVGSKLTLDFSSLLGPLFFLWLIQLPLPITLVQLVYEKEKRLRLMMRMHGLRNGVYTFITYAYFITVYIVYVLVMLIFGIAIDLKFFRLNDIGVQIVFYLLYGNVQVAFCFLLSCFYRSSRTAIVTGFLWVFASGLICFLLIDTFFIEQRWFTVLLELVPTFSAYRGLWELAQYSFKAAYENATAMTFSDLASNGNGMAVVWIILIVEWPLFMVMAWYLEQVLDSGTGVRKHWLFPITWCFGSRARAVNPDGEAFAVEVDDAAVPLTDDVERESARARAVVPDEDHPIVVRDLRKEFPKADGNPKKLAVANLSLCVPKGECFGLLGPNGAGKSTSINMMIGFLEPTRGEAFIAGHNLKEDMDQIYSIMGVCPQHDLLWEKLTSREHLNFYGRLKGLHGRALRETVDAALKSVNLSDVANKPCGQYSGGMKRRLSVAMSLIGSPKVVYLDEPSTGLDPASRRNLWDVVDTAKADKAVILTTHSMEEAEVLCDRLGIFVDGKLVCIGNPKELASRYGGYYVFTICVSETDITKAQALAKRLSPAAKETYALGGTLKYQIPMADITLSAIFQRVREASQQGLAIIDWGVHNASLEDVFIHLASKSVMYKKP